jgi:hypothetical protein
VHDASLQLNHEQHVEAAEQHGVDVEEIGGATPSAWARGTPSKWDLNVAEPVGDRGSAGP